MKIFLLLSFIFSIQLYSQQFLPRSSYFQDKLKRNLNHNIQLCFRNQNKKLFMNEHEKFKHSLKRVPYLADSFFLYDMVDYFPWEFYEKYIDNRILLYSFYGYLDVSIQVKKYDSQLLQISVPLEKLNFFNSFQKQNN